MSKDKYVLIALSVSGARGNVIRRYNKHGALNLLNENDFSSESTPVLISQKFIKVASEADIKAHDAKMKQVADRNKELDNSSAVSPKDSGSKGPSKSDLITDYEAISGKKAVPTWNKGKVKAEIDSLKGVENLKEAESKKFKDLRDAFKKVSGNDAYESWDLDTLNEELKKANQAKASGRGA